MTFEELRQEVDHTLSRLEETSMIWFDDDVDRFEFEEKVVDIFKKKFLDSFKDAVLLTASEMLWGNGESGPNYNPITKSNINYKRLSTKEVTENA